MARNLIEPLAPLELSDPRFESDGVRLATVNSRALHRRGDVTLWAPDGGDGPLPLVILLHGVYGSHWAWTQKAGAHRIARQLVEAGDTPPFAVAMPSDGLFGLGSGYVRHRGGDFSSWILDEVPWVAGVASEGRVDVDAPVALVGLSMGGFGALMLAARHPDRVRAAAGLSSITDFEQMRLFVGDISDYDVADDERSVFEAVVAARERVPPLRFDCGNSDPLIEPNRDLHDRLTAEGIAHEWSERTGGHEWVYWETNLPDALRFVMRES